MITAAFWTPSAWELGVILILGLLLFGRRLPEVGRSIGKTIVEFKKGIKDVKDDVDVHDAGSSGGSSRPPGELPTERTGESMKADERTVAQDEPRSYPAGGSGATSH